MKFILTHIRKEKKRNKKKKIPVFSQQIIVIFKNEDDISTSTIFTHKLCTMYYDSHVLNSFCKFEK